MMNENDENKKFPTLEQPAAVEVFNIVYNIYFVLNQKKHLLCFCHYQRKCTMCRISNFSTGWFKSQARRNRKYLIHFCLHFLKLKQEVLNKCAYKNIFFNNDYEYTSFANKCPEVHLIDIVYPEEILF